MVGGADLPPFEGRVGVEIAAKVAGQQKGLGVEQQADGDLLAEEGVVDFLQLPFLPGGKDFLATIVGEEHGAGRARETRTSRRLSLPASCALSCNTRPSAVSRFSAH